MYVNIKFADSTLATLAAKPQSRKVATTLLTGCLVLYCGTIRVLLYYPVSLTTDTRGQTAVLSVTRYKRTSLGLTLLESELVCAASIRPERYRS
jgi:hypothetical protein